MLLKALKERHDSLSLIIATLAVVLSQFPPLSEILRSSHIDLREEEYFTLFPNISSGFVIQQHLSLTNIGDKSGRANAVYLYITDPNENILHIARATNYLTTKQGMFGQAMWATFSELSLKPDDNWQAQVAFSSSAANIDLDEIRTLNAEMEDEKNMWEFEMEKQGFDPNSFDEKMPNYEVSESLLDKISKTVSKHIPWFIEGKYHLYEVIMTDTEKVYNTYDFTIDKYHLSNFTKAVPWMANSLPSIPATVIRLTDANRELPRTVEGYINKNMK